MDSIFENSSTDYNLFATPKLILTVISYHTSYEYAQIERCRMFESLYSLLTSNKVPFCLQSSYCKQVSFHGLSSATWFCIFVLLGGDFTVYMARMPSDEVLASVFKCKKIVLCFTEKTCVVDVLLSVRCYDAMSSMLVNQQRIHPEKGKGKSLNTMRLALEVLNKHLYCKKQLCKSGRVANFVPSWGDN